jgi:hypothetical protein
MHAQTKQSILNKLQEFDFIRKLAGHYFGVARPGEGQDNFTQFPLPIYTS